MALPRNLISKIYNIKAHDGNVTSLDLGETGRVLVTGGKDRNVNLWAIGQDECFMSLTAHTRSIECVRFAYKDNFVYSADDIGFIRRWDLNSQTVYSTLNGHMKSVRTLDFNPSGEYVVSGSNDTTVRLWDVQNENKCIKVCKGHISHVSSVKFSPDGLWIASAGLEGSILIWDIRKSKQIMEFVAELPVTPITCIQFHPYEFLLAAGRADGSVSIYDLDNQQLISQTSHFYGQAIQCVTFSENGECLFVGSASGISVIGWEPDRELNQIITTWVSLGDMKVVKNKLICGCHEIDTVSINTVSLDRLIYTPPNAKPNFKHNSTSRKSFSLGNQKIRLSLGKLKPAKVDEELEEKFHSYDERAPQNLSLKVVNEPALEQIDASPISSLHNLPQPISSLKMGTSRLLFMNRLSSLPVEKNVYSIEKDEIFNEHNVEYTPTDSHPPILTNYDNYELPEDFPVNKNLTHPTSSIYKMVPVSTINASSKSIKKTSTNLHKRNTGISNSKQTSAIFGNNKLCQTSSVSSMELHKLDVNMVLTKSSSSNVVNKNKRVLKSQSQIYKENTQQKNVSMEIITKPPMRSRTTLDMRTGVQEKLTHQPINYRPDLIPATSRNMNRYFIDDHDDYELDILSSSHSGVLQELSNRQSSLDFLRGSTRTHDVLGALKLAKTTGRSIFIDLLGAIIEKPSSWNLDFCTFVLPELYEMLQSQHKFHFTRACDTLRIIISNFLPTIKENLDSWAVNGLGVDVTREDRQKKSLECQKWLQQIKNLPETVHFGSTLSQLQNYIIF